MALLFKTFLVLVGLVVIVSGARAVARRTYEDDDDLKETGLPAILLGIAKICGGLIFLVAAFRAGAPSGSQDASSAMSWLFRLCVALSGFAALLIGAKAVLLRHVTLGQNHQHEVTGIAAVVLGLAGMCAGVWLMARGLWP